MKYSKELKIGIFVVTILTVSFFVINYLRGKDIFDKEVELISFYDNIEGLSVSAPVYIKGYKAGKVSEISYRPEEDDFMVICSVKKEFRIPEDSRMTIYAVDIMGGKGIRLDLGTSEVQVSDGASLCPGFEAGLLDSLGAGIGPLLEKVTNTMDSLSLTVSSVNALLSDGNISAISSTLRRLEGTMRNVESVSKTIGGKSAELTSFIENLSTLSLRLNSIAQKADTTLTGVNTAVASINESDISGVISSLHDLLRNINDPDGSIGKLLSNGAVYDSLDSLLKDVDELVRKIQENPKKYIKISVF